MEPKDFITDLAKKIDESFSTVYIGVAGNARSGKDTLAATLHYWFSVRAIFGETLALATPLKKNMHKFLLENFNIDVYNCTDEEKTLIRPLLVEYGKVKRRQTQGKFFTDYMDNTIADLEIWPEYVIISDIRYAEYESTDELFWLKNHGGQLIYVERVLENGEVVPPANDDERKNNIILRENTDLIVTWNTFNCPQNEILSNAQKFLQI